MTSRDNRWDSIRQSLRTLLYTTMRENSSVVPLAVCPWIRGERFLQEPSTKQKQT